MITKIIDENSISVMPEDSDDLLNLRRIIKKNDKVIGDTTRVQKQDKDYSRPDKGERIKVRIALTVEKISLDDVLDRLRIGGTISESSNESVPHGSHHSFILKINDGITISKKRWTPIEKNLLVSSNSQVGFVLVAIDTGDCGIARLRGTHLEFIPNIYSGSGGKRYKTNFNIEKFFEQVQQAVSTVFKKGDSIVVFGPGETKKRFVNFIQKSQKYKVQVVEGIDSGGEDGIYIFTKSQTMKEIMSDSKLAKVSSIIDEIMLLANKKSTKFTMGFDETFNANQIGAVESLVFSDKAIQDNEQKMIDFLNDVESKGVKIYSVDSSTDIGLRVTGLGGIVSLLRYAIES
ncbi:mRNA surveillance protein pelota [Marine Group I thaumarchaeote]|jgi:protein pelota|uniref:Protein pelota homolog n=1 Tax=Marine Group I thaumarchaeote TaxID=2511932 RepID=A0A7K4N3W7_9ARCH|nr:MAG: mRNA surveillance protein pelota [Nitrosopumilus sp. YT1]NMI82477.1 mRNA surveillance protein pelota [Candidatus Nitrosopumilus sp. MTA1]NWJ29299.1 mRNA surveillance protein pelota [Marine Group I thaumarchaeote]NWJ56601.1 mRNA surveillance protein pelota [Marine Group I thaumarchaeote]NWJ83131.1 mRNA surveillance protein pelota [Marine Group I thaumarchaeote]